MVTGRNPPSRAVISAPNRAKGSVMRRIGRRERLASPVKVAVIGVVAMAPMISRTPVPELPQSITPAGSAKPPTPTPWTTHSPSPTRVTSAPKARMALAVSSTSCPSSSPVIRVSPTASAPRISARWLTDLSPGTSAAPVSGPPRRAVSGWGSAEWDMSGLLTLADSVTVPAGAMPRPFFLAQISPPEARRGSGVPLGRSGQRRKVA